MKQQILRINQIKLDEKLYPRTRYDWFTANDYKNSMLAGAVFPPIEVAFFNRTYYLIDGKHRIEARKQLKEENIQCLIHNNLSSKDIFERAVKANINHGRPLSTQDKVMVIDRLEKLNFSQADISKLINIPIEKIQKFKICKITNTISGETIYLKSTAKNFAGIEVPDNFNNMQSCFSTRGQVQLLTQIINLVRDGLLDLNNSEIVQLTLKLKSIMVGLKIPLKIKR